MKILNEEHYAYLKVRATTIDSADRYGYDLTVVDSYETFKSLEDIKYHYQNRPQYDTGVYIKITPLKIKTTVEVSE